MLHRSAHLRCIWLLVDRGVLWSVFQPVCSFRVCSYRAPQRRCSKHGTCPTFLGSYLACVATCYVAFPCLSLTHAWMDPEAVSHDADGQQRRCENVMGTLHATMVGAMVVDATTGTATTGYGSAAEIFVHYLASWYCWMGMHAGCSMPCTCREGSNMRRWQQWVGKSRQVQQGASTIAGLREEPSLQEEMVLTSIQWLAKDCCRRCHLCRR